MSDQKTVPKGLHENEVEQGNFKKPPILYIPVNNKIGEKVKSEVQTFKVKIDNKTTVNTSVWAGGNPNWFLIHVISAMNYTERSKLFEKWVSAKTATDKCVADLQDVQKHLDSLVIKLKKAQFDTTATTTAKTTKKGMTNTPTFLVDTSDKIQQITDEIDQFKEHYKDHLESLRSAQEKWGEAGNAIFALHNNLLHKTALLGWTKIIQKQIGTAPWTNLNGKTHNTDHQKMVKSFKGCVKIHLLQVFPNLY